MKERKPSKLEQLTSSIEQDYAHQHSTRIIAKRAILNFTLGQIEGEIIRMSAALSKMKKQKTELTARISGLGKVLEKR